MSFFNRTTLNMTPSAVNSVTYDTHGGQQNVEPKSVHSSMSANANFVVNSLDRFGGTILNPTKQPLNNFNITRQGNILQGMFESLKVQELNFQWGVPNIVAGINNQLAFFTTETNDIYILSVTEGFYTGTTLATALTTLASQPVVSTESGLTITLDDPPIFTYQPNGTFKVTASGTTQVALFDVFYGSADPFDYGNLPINSPSLLSTMGFNSLIANYSVNSKIIISGFAPMLYTSYIDICSSQLTQFQNTGDAMTALANKGNLICRVYLSDETSTATVDASGCPIYPGQTPFIIHRQFKNPKVMKWNGQNSIATIDIQLYDQYGRLLYVGEKYTNLSNTNGYVSITNSVGEFQLTFTASEV